MPQCSKKRVEERVLYVSRMSCDVARYYDSVARYSLEQPPFFRPNNLGGFCELPAYIGAVFSGEAYVTGSCNAFVTQFRSSVSDSAHSDRKIFHRNSSSAKFGIALPFFFFFFFSPSVKPTPPRPSPSTKSLDELASRTVKIIGIVNSGPFLVTVVIG